MSNIPINEPALAQAALDAAAAAESRPRPIHKFKNMPPSELETPSSTRQRQDFDDDEEESASTPGENSIFRLSPCETDVHPDMQLININQSSETPRPNAVRNGLLRPSFLPFTPRASTDIGGLQLMTPTTTGNHLATAFGIPTPVYQHQRQAENNNFRQHNRGGGGGEDKAEAGLFRNQANSMNYSNSTGRPYNPLTQRSARVFTNSRAAQPFPLHPPRLQLSSKQDHNAPFNVASSSALPQEDSVTDTDKQDDAHRGSLPMSSFAAAEWAGMGHKTPMSLVESGSATAGRFKRNLTLNISDSNRGEDATDTPSSGLQSLPSRNSQESMLNSTGLRSDFGTSPTGNHGWGSWMPLAPVVQDSDGMHVPLTPFLNGNMEGFGMALDGSFTPQLASHGSHFTLPSPTNAGLVPLSAQGIGSDTQPSTRFPFQTSILGKRQLDEQSSSERDRFEVHLDGGKHLGTSPR